LLPEFIREALDEPASQDAEVAQGLDQFVAKLEPSAADPKVLERLLATVSTAPQRYAPFFGKLEALLDLPRERVQTLLSDMQDRKRFHGSGLPGVKVFDFEAGPRLKSAETIFVEFAPGMRFPRHRHGNGEAVLILEGSYTDETGVVYGPGDLHEMAGGTEHSFRVSATEPCVAAAVIHGGFVFKSLPLRLLARIFGR
jgi:predicted ChrR family anti-sigma factor